MNVYLDNSATTTLDTEVFESMKPYYTDHFGNPSSTHSYGRAAKTAIEISRKKIAELLDCSPSEIYFTSGGTESDNIAINGLVHTYYVKHIISTRIEHHAVLHTIGQLQNKGEVEVHFLDLDNSGSFETSQLEELLKKYPRSLVSIMHANNEIGNLIDLKTTGEICREYEAWFQSDTVQSIGRYLLDLKKTPVHSVSGSAHKFHGPKGTGFLYVRSDSKIRPMYFGGGQERDLRPGTENVAGIVGMTKALEIATSSLIKNREHIETLKRKLIEGLRNEIPGISFNGLSDDMEKSLYSLVNVSLPPSPKNEMILFQLDIRGISASGGSACGSGALKGSHVINELGKEKESTNIRFSISKMNTEEEIDYTIRSLKEILS